MMTLIIIIIIIIKIVIPLLSLKFDRIQLIRINQRLLNSVDFGGGGGDGDGDGPFDVKDFFSFFFVCVVVLFPP